jgi:hypothetical protein
MAIFVMSTRSSPGDILPSNASQRRDWVQFVRERVKWSGGIGSAGTFLGADPNSGFARPPSGFYLIVLVGRVGHSLSTTYR